MCKLEKKINFNSILKVNSLEETFHYFYIRDEKRSYKGHLL